MGTKSIGRTAGSKSTVGREVKARPQNWGRAEIWSFRQLVEIVNALGALFIADLTRVHRD